jgi:hypothetical protein
MSSKGNLGTLPRSMLCFNEDPLITSTGSHTDDQGSSTHPCDIIVTVKTAPLRIDTPDLYKKHMWDVLKYMANCMHTDLNNSRDLPMYLYNQLIKQGRVRKGHYETQMPHLLRIESLHTNPEKKDIYIKLDRDFTTKPYYVTSTLVVNPSYGLRSGLYVCSISFTASNHLWRIEDIKPHFDETWCLDDVFRQIPECQPTKCDGHFVLSILRYTAPLPPERSGKRRWAFPMGTFADLAADFKRVFEL